MLSASYCTGPSLLFVVLCLTVSLVRADRKHCVHLYRNSNTDQNLSDKYLSDERYWIFFCRSNDTDQNLPSKDFSEVVNQIQTLGANVVTKSKWLYAVSVYATEEQLLAIKAQPYVKEVLPVRSFSYAHTGEGASTVDERETINDQREQINADYLEKKRLTGKGVKIGVIDGNFYQADQEEMLQHLFEAGRVKQWRDFVDPESLHFFDNAQHSLDNHGTLVLKRLAGVANGEVLGLAPEAEYYLARTDHTYREFRGEEDHFVAALEWMDSLGVRLINCSLGYSYDFDDPQEDYGPAEMDGESTVISRACKYASERGMVIITSVGNEGDDEWRYVTAPADAKDVISVGAIGRSGSKQEFSGVGPESLHYLKPDVSCYEPLGTSFSAPVITGLIACAMQEQPEVPVNFIKENLLKSSQLYPYCNNYVGCGAPDSKKFIRIMNGRRVKYSKVKSFSSADSCFTFDRNTKRLTSSNDTKVPVFHLKDSGYVSAQTFITSVSDKVEICQPSDTSDHTLFRHKNVLYKIDWTSGHK